MRDKFQRNKPQLGSQKGTRLTCGHWEMRWFSSIAQRLQQGALGFKAHLLLQSKRPRYGQSCKQGL